MKSHDWGVPRAASDENLLEGDCPGPDTVIACHARPRSCPVNSDAGDQGLWNAEDGDDSIIAVGFANACAAT